MTMLGLSVDCICTSNHFHGYSLKNTLPILDQNTLPILEAGQDTNQDIDPNPNLDLIPDRNPCLDLVFVVLDSLIIFMAIYYETYCLFILLQNM